MRIESLSARRVLASLTGTVFLDTDRSNHRSGDEPAAEGRIVFADANENGRLDDAEVHSLTGPDGRFDLDLSGSNASAAAALSPDGVISVAIFNGSADPIQTAPVAGLVDSAIGGVVDWIDSAAGGAVLEPDRLLVPDASGDAFTTFALPGIGTAVESLGNGRYLVALDRPVGESTADDDGPIVPNQTGPNPLGFNAVIVDAAAGTTSLVDLSGGGSGDSGPGDLDAAGETIVDVAINPSGRGVSLNVVSQINVAQDGVSLEDIVSSEQIGSSDSDTSLRLLDLSDIDRPVVIPTSTTFRQGSSLVGSSSGVTTVIASPADDGLTLSLVSNADGNIITQATVQTATVQTAAVQTATAISGAIPRFFDAAAGLLAIQTGDATSVFDVDNQFSLIYRIDAIAGPTFIDSARDRILIAGDDGQISIFNLEDGRAAQVIRYDHQVIGQATDLTATADGRLEIVGVFGVANVSPVLPQSLAVTLDLANIGPDNTGLDNISPDNTGPDNTGTQTGLPIEFGVLSVPGNRTPMFDSDTVLSVREDGNLALTAEQFLGQSSDPDGDSFVVLLDQEASNGSLEIATDGTLNYRPDADFFGDDSFRIRLHDGQNQSDPFVITINVSAVPDAPTGGGPAESLRLPENASIGTVFGTIIVDDVDGQNHQIVVDDERFTVSDDGEIIFASGSINHETEPFIPIQLTATDPETSQRTEFSASIEVENRNDPITGITPTSARVQENDFGAPIAELQAQDEDQPDQFILFSVVDDDRFVIFDNDLRLADDVALDFEQTPTVTVTVMASEFQGEHTFTQEITISVINAFEQPSEISLSDNVVTELVEGDVVGDVLIDGSTPDERFEFFVDDPRFVFEGNTLRIPEREFVRSQMNPAIVTITAVDTVTGTESIVEEFQIDILPNDFPAHNLDNPFDVNHDGEVLPIDVLVVINYLRANGPGVVGDGPLTFCIDVNGDGLVTPLDALLVINQLNRQSAMLAGGGLIGGGNGAGVGGGGDVGETRDDDDAVTDDGDGVIPIGQTSNPEAESVVSPGNVSPGSLITIDDDLLGNPVTESDEQRDIRDSVIADQDWSPIRFERNNRP